MAISTGTIDWRHWLERWDRQQTGYNPEREERFGVMFDAVETIAGDEFVAIDLACGPGALSTRLLRRFPAATSIAVDLDPVLLAIGRGAQGDVDGRLTWCEADLNDPRWADVLPVRPVDAVLSTTALHWLPAPAIVQLYRTLAGVLRPGGIFLNGDTMQFRPGEPALRRVAGELSAARRAAQRANGAEEWDGWWAELRQEPALAGLFAERDRRFTWRPAESECRSGSSVPPRDADAQPESFRTDYELHRAALLHAGFAEVGTIWQRLENRVLAAIR